VNLLVGFRERVAGLHLRSQGSLHPPLLVAKLGDGVFELIKVCEAANSREWQPKVSVWPTHLSRALKTHLSDPPPPPSLSNRSSSARTCRWYVSRAPRLSMTSLCARSELLLCMSRSRAYLPVRSTTVSASSTKALSLAPKASTPGYGNLLTAEKDAMKWARSKSPAGGRPAALTDENDALDRAELGVGVDVEGSRLQRCDSVALTVASSSVEEASVDL
jgi:hypothetical protein